MVMNQPLSVPVVVMVLEIYETVWTLTSRPIRRSRMGRAYALTGGHDILGQ